MPFSHRVLALIVAAIGLFSLVFWYRMPVTSYIDEDGDGYGSSVSMGQVTPGILEVTIGGDCNDQDPLVHPAAIDLVGDILDQDCDGVAAPEILFWTAGTEHQLNATNLVTGALLDSWPIPDGQVRSLAGRDGHRIYVGYEEPAGIWSIDTQTGRATQLSDAAAHHLYYDPVEHRLLVAQEFQGKVLALDLTTNTLTLLGEVPRVTAAIRLAGDVRVLASTREHARVYGIPPDGGPIRAIADLPAPALALFPTGAQRFRAILRKPASSEGSRLRESQIMNIDLAARSIGYAGPNSHAGSARCQTSSGSLIWTFSDEPAGLILPDTQSIPLASNITVNACVTNAQFDADDDGLLAPHAGGDDCDDSDPGVGHQTPCVPRIKGRFEFPSGR